MKRERGGRYIHYRWVVQFVHFVVRGRPVVVDPAAEKVQFRDQQSLELVERARVPRTGHRLLPPPRHAVRDQCVYDLKVVVGQLKVAAACLQHNTPV